MKNCCIAIYFAVIIILAPSPVQAADWKALQIDSEGHEVYALKLLLRNQNCDPGEINTAFDEITREALVSFQVRNQLDPDGKAGPDTWKKLISTVSNAEHSGEINDAVLAVQYLLRNKYAFTALAEDGTFGIETKAAVLLFQYNYKLGTNGTNGMDGIVGAKTWSYMIHDSTKAKQSGWVICIELNEDRSTLGTLYAFDAEGKKNLEIPCLAQSMTMNPNWRDKYANTPLGCFKASVSRRSRNKAEFGIYKCIELDDTDVRAVTNGRDRILIHSGSNAYKHKTDYSLPVLYKGCRAQTISGLDQTHGCIRISGNDHAKLYFTLKDQAVGIVSISEI